MNHPTPARRAAQETTTVNTRTLATLARVAANPAVDQRHLGEYSEIRTATFAHLPGAVQFMLSGGVSLPLLNSLIAWGYLLDRPQVHLTDYGIDGRVHVHVSGHLHGDHVAAWTGVDATAAAMLRAAMGGERKTVVPLCLLRSVAVRLCTGEADSR